jgi:hypothetical protein
MISDSSYGNNEILDELEKLLPSLANPVRNPEQFVRDLHRRWKDAGGILAGKPRHSDRHLDDQLRQAGKSVRSLVPKLTGRTHIKADDADTLIQFFLSNWPQEIDDEDLDVKSVRYQPLLPFVEIDEIVQHVLDHLREVPEVSSRPGVLALPGHDVLELITSEFERSDAFFVVATDRATIAQSDKTVLLGFRDLINRFYQIAAESRPETPLIWIIDIGQKNFEDEDARLRYISFNRLQMRFKALREFDDLDRSRRWEWLKSRVAFLVQDPSSHHVVDMTSTRQPTFHAHHLSLNTIHESWASSPNFRTLYGRLLENLKQRSFTVSFIANSLAVDADHRIGYHCRYHGFASFPVEQTPAADPIPRGLDLPFMNLTYEHAYRTAYVAASELLGLPNRLPAELAEPAGHAAAQLRYLRFHLIGLEEFMNL